MTDSVNGRDKKDGAHNHMITTPYYKHKVEQSFDYAVMATILKPSFLDALAKRKAT